MVGGAALPKKICSAFYVKKMQFCVLLTLKQGYKYRTVAVNFAFKSTGVATGGHGWARAHPTSARVGREICTNSKFFCTSRGGGGG